MVDGPGGRVESVGLVPSRLLTQMITDGPRLLDDHLVDRIMAEVDQHTTAIAKR